MIENAMRAALEASRLEDQAADRSGARQRSQ